MKLPFREEVKGQERVEQNQMLNVELFSVASCLSRRLFVF